ncbi:SHOCT domain-containing protein [Streptomyces sp. NPDC059835]|uniref:SHOCT domain-containing protein n=1 Tax=Streptomyces sp. NPDC059835 TaxID=3346967 RepID=UPI003653E5F2
MLGRRLARGGRPGIVGVAARTAVVAGTATAVSGRVARHQAEKAAAQQVVEQPEYAPAPAAAPAAAGGMTDETLDALERLGKLHEQGVLTDTEFAVQKDRLLRS